MLAAAAAASASASRGGATPSASSTTGTIASVTSKPTTVATGIATKNTMMARRTIARTTTITSDPGILCFHHCNVKVFCFTLPHICPNCKSQLDTIVDGSNGSSSSSPDGNGNGNGNGELVIGRPKAVQPFSSLSRLLPFRLPYPFVRASQSPCAIVLRPTTGDFLNDYNNATDLHIAVTTSTGCIVEFDRNGLQRHRTDNMPEWWQCLLVGNVPEPWYDYWDQVLLQSCKQQPDRWTIAHYHEDTHNCYTFVLAFLQSLGYHQLSIAAQSKTIFCEKYIVPKTTTAGKYISLYRKLRDAGVYVHPHQRSQQRSQNKEQYEQQQQHHKQQQQQQQQQHGQQESERHGQPLFTKGRSNASVKKKSVLKATNSSKEVSNGQSNGNNSIISRSPRLCTIDE